MIRPEQFTEREDLFVAEVYVSISAAEREQFRELERMILVTCMRRTGMADRSHGRYPPVVGDPSGEYAAGDCLCPVCGLQYAVHPPDWRLCGYGDVPFLNVLCDGRRVKL